MTEKNAENSTRCAQNVTILSMRSLHQNIYSKQTRYISESYKCQFMTCLRKLQEEQMFCDISIHVEDRTFLAHQVALAAGGQYFQAMFSSKMYDVQNSSIRLHDVAPETFQSILTFIYSGEITITEDNCQDVLAAADMFGITCVVKLCTEFLHKQLHSENCVGIFQFADIHACDDLKTEAQNYIYKNFVNICQEEEYMDLTEELLIEILQSENLCVSCETEVLQAAMNWLLYDPVHRRTSVFNVLEHIRFPVIPESDLNDILEQCQDLSIKIAVKKYSQDLLRDRNLCRKLNLMQIKPHLLQPRKSARKRIYIIGGYFHAKGGRWSDIHTLETVERFDTYTQQWEVLPSICYPRNHMGTAVINGQIYIAGGENDSLIYDFVERFDPLNNKWEAAPGLTQPRCGLGLASLDDCLYAFGGWVGIELGDTVEKFDPANNRWTIIGTMPTLRFEIAVIEFDGLIYVIGGMDKDYGFGSELATVESFNPVTNEWEELSPLNTPRANASVVSLNGYLYVIGGFNTKDGDLSSVERYCPDKNHWINMPSMNQKRTAPCAVSVNGLIYVMGGRQFFARLDMFSCNETLNSMECFDPLLNCWHELPPMPTPRCEAGAVVL